jgi:hypothetical protein
LEKEVHEVEEQDEDTSNLCEICKDAIERRKKQPSPNAENNGKEDLEVHHWQYSAG